MHTHEYQIKNLLQHYGIPLPPFAIASNLVETRRAISELGLHEAVLKVQVHAGGRGKAGGVKFAHDPDEALHFAEAMIGMKITNNQTGPQGVVAQKILISAPVRIRKEFYVAIVIDRKEGAPFLIASSEGGMEIEEIAMKMPKAIHRERIGLNGKLRNYQLLTLAKFLGWDGKLRDQGRQLLSQLTEAFMENDFSLLEINPLVLSEEGKLLALDAKCSVDDNALFRQPALTQWYDASQYTEGEVLAKQFSLAYVGLDGDIGCMVNGAGLAMATMDILLYYGGKPANFLDVGGGASMEKVAHGFKILLTDFRLKAIFVNIFGGIMDCGVLARGIVEAAEQNPLKVPLVIRMEGTNVEIGKKILRESQLRIVTADQMAEGAKKAVEAAGG